MLNKSLRLLHWLEDGALLLTILLLVSLSLTQIIFRNMDINGMIWLDSANRVLVLWLAMIGALRASRHQQHIAIDILPHYAGPNTRKLLHALVSLCCAAICAIAAWYSLQFVLSERQYGDIAFLNVPFWLCQSVIPASLVLIALRFLLNTLKPPEVQYDRT